MSSIGRREFLTTTALALTARATAGAGRRRLLYVAEPGIRNYVDYGGVGLLVFDVDANYRFVRRIPTWDVPHGHEPENVKGHRRQRAHGPSLRHDAAPYRVLRSPDGSPAVGQAARGRLRPPRRLAGWTDAVRAVVRGTPLERARRGDGRDDGEDRHEFRRAQHDLCGRWPACVSGGPPLAAAVDCRSGVESCREDDRPLLQLHPSVHGQRAQIRCFVNVNELLGSRSEMSRLRRTNCIVST